MGHRAADRRASRAPLRAFGTLFAPGGSVLGPGRAGLRLPDPHRPGGHAAQHSRRDRIVGGAHLHTPAQRRSAVGTRGRGGKARNEKPIPSHPTAPDSANAHLRVAGPAAAPSPGSPVVSIPATIEGTISSAGEARRARFRVDSPVDIAIEIETQAAAPPLFNPIVRLLDAAGTEVATNILAGRGACTGALTKSQEVKTLVPLRDAGEYTIEVRDATSDLGGEDYCFRVQIRPQVPHVGNVRIDEDRVDLAPGEAKTVRVAFDREEDFRGAVAVWRNLSPPESGSSQARITSRRRIRRRARQPRALCGATNEPLSSSPRRRMRRRAPQVVRLVVRPVVDGKTGAILAAREIPLVVIAEP